MRVFVTPGTAPDFESVAATLANAGHTVASRTRKGGFLHALPEDTRTLLESDFLVALPDWRDSPESTTDVLTADGAGIPWGGVDDALATHRPPTRDRTALPSQQHPR